MPAVSRKGDAGVPHCSGYVIAEGSPDVYLDGRPVARVGDRATSHLKPGSPCKSHTPPIVRGSSTVFVNGRQIARIGDPLAACTTIAEGSPNMFAG
jgi:uncharacterized Zn-binding protein involved in type VI secretion